MFHLFVFFSITQTILTILHIQSPFAIHQIPVCSVVKTRKQDRCIATIGWVDLIAFKYNKVRI